MNLDPFAKEKEMARQALEEAKAARKLNEDLLFEMREIRKLLEGLRADINLRLPVLPSSSQTTYTPTTYPIPPYSPFFASTQAEDSK